jgi:O-antigen ligase
MVVPALGSAGSPSNLLGIATFFWWIWFQISRTAPTGAGRQPVRLAMLGWLLIMFAVYAHAMGGPIPGDEISVADSGMLRLLGIAGVLLLANDGIADLPRLRILLRRLCLAAGIVALLGLLQYVTGTLWIDRIRLPGLTAGTADWSLGDRAGFVRPSGTSTSPIEYGVVLGMALPLLIAFSSGHGRARWLYRVLLVATVVAIFLSVSRSAYLCAGIGVAVMALVWTNRQRLVALGFLAAVTVVMYVSVPRLLGSIQGLFSNAADDPSVASRTGSYEIAWDFFTDSPVIGRGFGTFLPKYWVLDNGYLGLLIEGGVLGLAGLLAVIVTGCVAAHTARRTSSDDHDRTVAQSLLAAIVAGAFGLAFFDTFAFPQTAGCFFLLIGLAGAMRRLVRVQAGLIG